MTPTELRSRIRLARIDRRDLCRALTRDGDDYRPTPAEQHAWQQACEKVRRLRSKLNQPKEAYPCCS